MAARRRGGRSLRRLASSSVVIAVAASGPFAPPVAGAGPAATVRPTQELARLLTHHAVIPSLAARRSPVRTVPAWRPITRGPTVLPVTGRATTADGDRWLRVLVPGRPNGTQGWIAQRGTVPERTSWHLVVRTSVRQVRVYHGGRLRRTFAAVVGKPSTPTPHGRFFVEESIRMLPGSAGGPFALALSARSNVLQEFAGGPGQIGIHGVQNLGGTPGTAISHGCVRLANRNIRWLAARIVPGVPVTMTP